VNGNWLKLDRECKIVLSILAAMIPVCIIAAVYVVNSQDYLNSDFFTFWLAGRMTWTNQSAYAADQWIGARQLYGLTFIPDPIFPYPLPLALLFAPLGLLPVKTAYIVWVACSGMMIAASVLLLLSETIRRQKGVHLILPVFLSILVFRATLLTLRNGQLGAFLLLATCLAISCWQKGRWRLGAVILSFLLLKPTIGVLVIAFAAIWLLLHRNWKAILTLAASGAGWLSIGFLQNPRWVSLFLSSGLRKTSETLGHSPNLWGLGSAVCGPGAICTVGLYAALFMGILLLTVLVLIARRNAPPLAVFSLALPAAVLLTPYIWPYDHILMLVPIAFVTIRMFEAGFPYLVTALFPISMSMLSIGLLFLALASSQDAWSALLPLTCLALVVWGLYARPGLQKRGQVVAERA
jgi:hypothetical protein